MLQATAGKPERIEGTSDLTLMIGATDFVRDAGETLDYQRSVLPDARRFISSSHPAKMVDELRRSVRPLQARSRPLKWGWAVIAAKLGKAQGWSWGAAGMSAMRFDGPLGRLSSRLLALAFALVPACSLADVLVHPPGAPVGIELRLAEDCQIVSSGGPPDAHLQCAPGLGWRLFGPGGRLIYPERGYLRRDVQWRFGPSAGLLETREGLVLVALPSGEAHALPYAHMAGVETVTGLDALALAWTDSGEAALIGRAGEVVPLTGGPDFLGAAAEPVPTCRMARLLAAAGVERMANRRWKQIRRMDLPGLAQADVCARALGSALAGQDEDGWRRLDPATLGPVGERVHASPKGVLAEVISDHGGPSR